MPKHTGSLDIGQDERGRIVGLKEGGWSNRRIAAVIGCSPQTVSNVYNKWLEKGNTINDRQNCRRERHTTPAQDQTIVLQSRQDPFKPATRIVQELQLPVSAKTVIRRLNANGLKSCWAARKETLTQRHRDERIGFALQHLEKTPDDWRNAVFCDESCVQIGKNGRLRVWRKKGERFSDGFVQSIIRSGRFSVPVWGWISGTGAGNLHRIEGQLNSAQYVDILEQTMKPTVTAMFGTEDVLFAHDNSPIHTAHIVQDWFNANPQFSCLQWPARSPDLNPIENAWAQLKTKVDVNNVHNADELWTRLEEVWDTMLENLDYWEATALSMPTRLRKVLDNAGSWTKY